MAYTIPNRPDTAYAPLARFYSIDAEILAYGSQLTGVKTGCAVTAQVSPNMTVAVAAGTVYWQFAEVAVTSGNVTVTAAHASLDRLDIVVVNSSGTKSVVAGTPATVPLPPAIPASSVVLALIVIPAADTTIAQTQISDKRHMVQVPAVAGASVIVRKTANQTVTSDATIDAANNDNHLFFAMTSNGIWSVKFVLFGQSAVSSAMRINFAGPAGAIWRMQMVNSGSTANLSSDGIATDFTTSGMSTTGGSTVVIQGVVTTAATAGNFQLRFAQAVSSGTALTMLMNSYLEYRLLT